MAWANNRRGCAGVKVVPVPSASENKAAPEYPAQGRTGISAEDFSEVPQASGENRAFAATTQCSQAVKIC